MAAIPLLPRNHPLGPNPYNADTHPAWHRAYGQCLQLQTSTPQLASHALCLGYLLIEAVDDPSRDYITKEILLCVDSGDKLKDMAKFYVENILVRLCDLVLSEHCPPICLTAYIFPSPPEQETNSWAIMSQP
jgi:hypothetical protein